MVCPYCETKNQPQSAVCNHCGVILRGAAHHPPRRPLRSGHLRRLAAAGKNLYYANLYRVRHTALEARIKAVLTEAGERYEGELKSEAVSHQTRLNLAALHLLEHQIEKSVQAFQFAQRFGAAGTEFSNNAGIALARRGRLPQALEMFESAISSEPALMQPHANRAHALAEGAEDAASGEHILQEVRQLIALSGQNATAYNRLGIALCREQHFDQAVVQFEQALSLSGVSPSAQADARCNLGVARCLDGDSREAAREFITALALDPGHARALANEGLLELLGGDVDSGLERLHDAALMDPRSADIQSAVGYALGRSGAINEGIRASHEALVLSPHLFEPCYNLGKAYADAGLWDIAERYLSRACQWRPHSWQVQTTLGVVHVARKQTMLAIQCFHAANQLCHNQPTILLNLATALALNRQDREAERHLQQADRIVKGGADGHHIMGWIHLLRDSASLAAAEMEIALGTDDRNAVLHNNFGLAQVGLGAYEVALTHLRRANSLDSSLGPVYFHLGGVHALLKQNDLAIKSWEAAAKYELENADCFANLGTAYYRKGDFDAAVTHFRHALQIRQDRPEDHSNLGLAYAKQGVVLRTAAMKVVTPLAAGVALATRGHGDDKMKQSVEKQKQAIEMFDRALALDPRNVMLHSNRGLACFFASRAEEAMKEWATVTRIDPLYARKRGTAHQSEFDDSQVDIRPLIVPERAVMPPLRTADYQYRLLWGYDTDSWELVLSDPTLAPLPQMLREAECLARNLRARKL